MSTTTVVDTSSNGTTLTGTDGRDILIGRSGDDLLNGGAGSDSLKAGAGNDVLIYDELDWNIDGGSGFDTLRFLGTSQALDLRNSKVVSNIEQLQLWGGGHHHVYLDASSIKALSDNDAMLIWGDGTNTVDIGSGWTFAGLSADGHFEKFTNNGATIQTELAINIAGYSGNAVISSPVNPNVTEDSSSPTLTSSGSLSVTDPNAGQAYLLSAVDSAAGNLGHLSLATPGPYTGTATGAYSYSVANADVQYLGANATKVDSFTVHSIDGTAKTVSFTIHGVNDAAIISDDPLAAHHDVTEDSNVDGNGKLVAAGTLAVSDVDQGEAKFVATTTSGTYGAFSVDQNGQYQYLVDNASVQTLTSSDTRSESFHVTSVDGTGKDIAFTIHGANDAATITDDPNGAHYQVTEDSNVDSNGNLVATGTLTISDVDQGENHSVAVTSAGTYGTFNIDQDGHFTYVASNANPIIQGLNTGANLTDSFHVTSVDGTGKDLTFTIHGVDEPASLTVGAGGFHANVTEFINLFHGSAVASENDPDYTHIRSGKFALSDSDPTATINAVTVAADSGNNAMGSLVASVVDAPGGGKMVQWTFQVNDSQLDPLAANAGAASQVQNFTLTIADNHGHTTNTNVSIKLFGNDEISYGPDINGSGTISGTAGNERAFGSAGSDTYRLGSGNDIAYGNGGDSFIAQAGESLVAFGGNGNNTFLESTTTQHFIAFGGSNSSDGASLNGGITEIYGNGGGDRFDYRGGEKNYVWCGQGTDTINLFQTLAENWLFNFDTSAPASGGDVISLFNSLDHNLLHLVQHTTDANNPFLAEGETFYDLNYGAPGNERTLLKIVGEGLDLNHLIANGNFTGTF